MGFNGYYGHTRNTQHIHVIYLSLIYLSMIKWFSLINLLVWFKVFISNDWFPRWKHRYPTYKSSTNQRINFSWRLLIYVVCFGSISFHIRFPAGKLVPVPMLKFSNLMFFRRNFSPSPLTHSRPPLQQNEIRNFDIIKTRGAEEFFHLFIKLPVQALSIDPPEICHPNGAQALDLQ